MASKLDKMSVSELKQALKGVGMSQAGDKGTLVWRLALHQKCQQERILVDGQNPCSLKMGELKKHASKEGVSPIGNQDEILDAFVKVLSSRPPKNDSSDAAVESSSSSSQTSKGNTVDPIAVAKKILELAEYDDHEGILNIAANHTDQYITKQSTSAQMRKAYLKLSLLVHPDKLSKVFEQSTKAFQALVRAFDVLSSPDLTGEVGVDESSSRGKDKHQKKTAAISRSNEGCYRTRVCCPRCKQRWSEGTLDGNPDYFYNFLMQGLKSYSCSTCLCEFGCMTAIHKCPHCDRVFEYSIQDYHRRVNCPNTRCGKSFGFYMYHASDRVIKELKKDLKEMQERRIKVKESKQRRARLTTRLSEAEAERAFLLGLADCCPRCGEGFEGYPDEDSQREHLMLCTDSAKHSKHQQKVEEEQTKQDARESKRQKQEDAEVQATWVLLGSKPSQLWLLDEEQVRQRASELAVDTAGSKDEMIMRIVAATDQEENDDPQGQGAAKGQGRKRHVELLTNGESQTSGGGGSGSIIKKDSGSSSSAIVKAPRRRRLSADSLPGNLHSLPAAQLRSVCAANGLLLPPEASKSEILEIIESELFDETS